VRAPSLRRASPRPRRIVASETSERRTRRSVRSTRGTRETRARETRETDARERRSRASIARVDRVDVTTRHRTHSSTTDDDDARDDATIRVHPDHGGVEDAAQEYAILSRERARGASSTTRRDATPMDVPMRSTREG
jgi:hypothetical protein